MSDQGEGQDRVSADHTRQIARLRRIEGQVRGLQAMIEGGRGCIDIANQAEAVIAAMRRVQSDMLSDHMQALVQAALDGDLPDPERRRMVAELSRLVSRLR